MILGQLPNLSNRLSADDIACSSSRKRFTLFRELQRERRWLNGLRRRFLVAFAIKKTASRLDVGRTRFRRPTS
jgi:hypothetical protein